MALYRSKPSTIEAVRFNGGEAEKSFPGPIPDWLVEAISKGIVRREGNALILQTMQGPSRADPGHYVVREPDGVHVYPCHPDVFDKRWEPV